ncbi:MAG: RidA family protein [Kiloniellales bacterium]
MSSAITRMNPKTLPDAGKIGYSQISVAEAGRLAFVSGQVAWRRDEGAVAGTLAEQTATVIENLQIALTEIGAVPRDIVQLRVYIVDLEPGTQDILMPHLLSFLDGVQPSLTVIGVRALATPELQIEIEMVVQVPAREAVGPVAAAT